MTTFDFDNLERPSLLQNITHILKNLPKGGLSHDTIARRAWAATPESRRADGLQTALESAVWLRSDEMRHEQEAGKPYDLRDVLIGLEYSYNGGITPDDQVEQDTVEMYVDDIVRGLAMVDLEHALRQALAVAVPYILRQLSEEERTRLLATQD